jgi:hypothetical protein
MVTISSIAGSAGEIEMFDTMRSGPASAYVGGWNGPKAEIPKAKTRIATEALTKLLLILCRYPGKKHILP